MMTFCLSLRTTEAPSVGAIPPHSAPSLSVPHTLSRWEPMSSAPAAAFSEQRGGRVHCEGCVGLEPMLRAGPEDNPQDGEPAGEGIH